MKVTRFVIAWAIIGMTTGTLMAQQFVQVGNLRIRADSPLIKREYPRLLITRAQRPAIRARLAHPEVRTYLEQARELIRKGKPEHECFPLLTAVLYQMTGEKQYADMVKSDLGEPTQSPWWVSISRWIFTYDLVAETMTQQ